MRRRDLSTALMAAAGPAVLASVAQAQTAQTCNLPCYPQTAAELAAGVKPVDLSYPPQDIRRYGTIDPAGGTDSTATIQAWLSSGPAFRGNTRGRFFCPPGTYKVTSGLTLGLDQTLDCTGVVFDFRAAPATVVAITLSVNTYDFAVGDPLGGLSLIGPGAGTASVGIKLHGGGGSSPVVYMALRLGSVRAFGTGLRFDQFCWLDSFFGGHLGGNGIGILIVDAPSGGESLNFYGTVVEGSTLRQIRCVGSNADIVFHGGALDYPAKGAIAIDAEGSCNLTFFGTHLEQDVSCALLTNDSNVLGASVSFFGCQIVYPDGPPIVFIADKTNLSVRGGKFYIYSGTAPTGTLVSSNGAQNAIIEFDEMVFNRGGIKSYMIAGTGGVKRVRYGSFDKSFSGCTADSYEQAATLMSGSTVDTTVKGVAAATCSAPVTGLRLAPGGVAGQRFTLINQSSFTLTFDAAPRSKVADGAADVIAPLRAASYVWAPEAALWYRAS